MDNKNTAPKNNLGTWLLSIGLSVTVVLMIIFAVLYFTATKDKHFLEDNLSTVPATVAQTTAATEPDTQPPTEKPTSAKKKTSKKTEATTALPTFESYTVKLGYMTPVYAGPGYEYNYAMSIEEDGIYTIVSESINTKTGDLWGKLKSGVGWVNLSAVNYNYNYNYNYNNTNSVSTKVTPYLVTVYANTDVYAGPGFSYDRTMTIEEQGVYTIVEECFDSYNVCTWGKLKSGVGWINLG